MKKKILIIGAGPAGLAVAYEIVKQKHSKDFDIKIFEMDKTVGGISKTLNLDGYRFDLGGHRFYTKFPEIEKFYKSFLGKDMLQRERLSRIYYQRKFFDYPLSAINALTNLGLASSTKILISWFKRQFHRYKTESTFEQWVSNRFGDELFKIFFKSYTEKVWGMPTSKLSADWAAQRIQNFNLFKAILNATLKINIGAKTVIKKFYYPKLGPGMLYEKLKGVLEKEGVKIYLNSEIIGLKRKGSTIEEILVLKEGHKLNILKADYIVSTMPFDKLVTMLKPPPSVQSELNNLKFRNFITVNIVVRSNPFPDQWIYIHEPKVKVGRIQNFRNWSPYMVKEGEDNTPIGMEYFASEGDKIWTMQEKELVDLAEKEIVQIGLVKKEDILKSFTYKVRNAYPVYNFNYKSALEKAKNFVEKIDNLYLCGRGGLFRYNNQDHSILTGFYVGRNIINPQLKLDVWGINEESDYIEEK